MTNEYKLVPPNEEAYFSWENQVRQYAKIGKPGINYFRGHINSTHWIDCILYRNNSGELVGILNYYNQDEYIDGVLVEKKGNFNVFVKPQERGKGIGKKLLKAAISDFNVVLKDQYWTPTGWQMLKSFLKHG